ncbi:MAG: L-asparaginase 1 [Cytophagales bacterium CG12_big_fil_rev_8_21_14_0_65_40_12]|nr:MAG: L-asparaginase 1 [Cytophagales bacterium CG12_big_fil_rev_8_21_14_0_65_40_12]PIW05396.1 MAG: L-asparaginase 1 [Cytophagales bacterium CG17_big_fil_post_rev_8_21_14_2_50_40_13]
MISTLDFSTNPRASILIIYTGGTLGMDYNEHGALVPCDFERIVARVPVLKELNINLSVTSFSPPIDSSNVNSKHWVQIGRLIEENYEKFDGFIVLHGTDTMAYSASALSFMLQGLNKPVIFTGAQLPIALPRSDGRENFVTALEIAADKREGVPIISEVCVFFNHLLLRGNRSKKVESRHFDAFESENYPVLAEAGIVIDYNFTALKAYKAANTLRFFPELSNDIVVLKLFPGINEKTVAHILSVPNLRGLVMESYGSGNVPHQPWFLNLLESAVNKGVVVLNVSQCNGGNVIQGKYESSSALNKLGVISGRDLTTEAATTKMMHAFGSYNSIDEIRDCLIHSISGEMN